MELTSALRRASLAVFCLVALAPYAGAAGPTGRTVSLLGDLSRFAHVNYQNGHILLLEVGGTHVPGGLPAPADHSVTVLDGFGRQIFSRAPGAEVPDLRGARVQDAALTTTGILVVSTEFWGRDGPIAYALVQYDIHRGQLIKMVRLNPITCLRIATDSADNIWCLGIDVDKRNAKRKDYDVIYEYSPDGLFQRSLYPAAELPSFVFAPKVHTFPQLVASGGRIAAWLPASDALLVWTADGKIQERFTMAPRAELAAGIGDELAVLPGGDIGAFMVSPGLGASEPVSRRECFHLGGTGELASVAFPSAELSVHYQHAGVDGASIVLWNRFAGTLEWREQATVAAATN